MAERFRAAGEDQVGAAVGDVAIGGVDRLQARRAVALYGPGGDALAAAETQRGDARGVDLVRLRRDAAEDDLVERIRLERLTQQQRPTGRDGQIDG